ncbi:tape measure protein [Consotaella salsifontis]|uniref:Tape measure domain-containing protein n=1 Tax=Consotaella salsifontis TaxID=1365950 RepID=A0A1T4SSX8_9HYPH|nr:tape measure protein [Consotaella salsifontis]SKA31001.1 tape measure domain-containing protein [Consotaella salsifontis]
MATDIERLVVELSAQINKYDRDLRKAQGISDQRFRAIETRAQKMSKALQSSFSGIGRSLVAGLTAYVGVQTLGDIAKAAASYRDLQNALKVTGLEGEALAGTFNSLASIAMRQGAPLDALVTLYSRASLSAKDLHASQSELIQFSEGVATALRVQGTSASEASGALLQLTQALGNGTVQAEEYNSLLDGGQAILRTVAAGLKEAGGSVSELTKLVKSGQVSSEAFFRAFLAGQGQLQEQASKAEGTVAQSMNRIGTAMTLLIGHLDDTTRASSNAVANLNAVADVIQKLPSYIDAAAEGFESLNKWLNDVGNSSFFKKMNEILGVNEMTPDELRKLGINPAADGADSRVANAFSDTAGTGVATASKTSRVTSAPSQVSILDHPVNSSKTTKTKKAREDDWQRETRQIQEETEAIKAETLAQSALNPLIDDYGFTLEKARSEQELLTAAKRAGVTVTPQLRDQINQLATAYAQATAEANKLDESQSEARRSAAEMRDLGQDALGGFIKDLRDGKSAADAFADALGKIGDKLLDMALNNLFDPKSGGGLGGLLGGIGSLLSGARASGGPVSAGGAYLVGEKGPEIFAPTRSGTILPNSAVKSAGGQVYSPSYVIDARGAEAGVEQKIVAAIKEYDKGSYGRFRSNLDRTKTRSGALR